MYTCTANGSEETYQTGDICHVLSTTKSTPQLTFWCLNCINGLPIFQSCGSKVMMTHRGPDGYTFSTAPKPIAKDFTELCVLQTAEPFVEHFSLSTSTCDLPASYQAHLSPGTYHAVCSYRLTHGPASGTYSLASATPTIFFRACKCLSLCTFLILIF